MGMGRESAVTNLQALGSLRYYAAFSGVGSDLMAWRTFSVVLLALNCAAFGFAWFNPKPVPLAPLALEADVPPLVLLSERDSAQMQSTRRAASVATITPQAQYCERIGEFESEEDANSLRARLAKYSTQVEVKAVEQLQLRGYWVYLPQTGDREEALARARQLSAANVRDYYVVTEGENQNTISLGMFRDLENAEKRIAQVAKLGFSARRAERGDRVQRFWVEYRAASASKNEVAAMRGMDALKRETIFCDR